MLCTVQSTCHVNVGSIELQTFLLLLYFQEWAEGLRNLPGCYSSMRPFIEHPSPWGLAKRFRQVPKGEDGCLNEGGGFCLCGFFLPRSLGL